MRVADVARVVGDHGGPGDFVRYALAREAEQRRRTRGQLMDEVATCGGLVPFAAAIVANVLAVETMPAGSGVTDLSLALDHGRTLLVALDRGDLADLVAQLAPEVVVEP